MDIAFTDFVQPDLDLERSYAAAAGLSMRVASPQCRSEADVIGFVADAEAIVVQEAPITRTVIEALPALRLISLAQVGSSSVDLQAAFDLGVWVANVPDANVTEVAAHAAAMTFALVRHLPAFDASVRAGVWNYAATGPLIRPSELTIGLIGLGRIGQLYASYVTSCFGPIIAYDPHLPVERWPAGIRRVVRLEELLGMADVVSIHVPLIPDTRGLMNAERFRQMKQNAILINDSRGPLVDIPALIEALDTGHLAAAGLDVLPKEPPEAGDPILSHPKVLLSPHAAFFSLHSDEETRRRSVNTIAAFMATGRPNDVVVEGRR
jgi:D-3-phosphoglycerate dehydrogenase